MAYESFSAFLTALERAGELRRVAVPVATELEITEWADREMKSPGGGQALLFEKPTVNGVVSPFPLAVNTMGSTRRMAMALNLLRDERFDALITGEIAFADTPQKLPDVFTGAAGLMTVIRYS